MTDEMIERARRIVDDGVWSSLQGDGAQEPDPWHSCRTCGGTGIRSIGGPFLPCPDCQESR